VTLPHNKLRGFQESWGCLFAVIILLAISITALGYWLG
jgi:hypothetical protein